MTTIHLSDVTRSTIVCTGCGEKRHHKAKGLCSTCYTRARRPRPVCGTRSAYIVHRNRDEKPCAACTAANAAHQAEMKQRRDRRLTDAENASLRQMIGWRADWVRDESQQKQLDAAANENRSRIVACLAREGYTVLDRLPWGTGPRIRTELGISEWQWKRYIDQLRTQAREQEAA